VVSLTPRPLYPQGKSSYYPLDRRLGGLQSRSGCGGEEKTSFIVDSIFHQLRLYSEFCRIHVKIHTSDCLQSYMDLPHIFFTIHIPSSIAAQCRLSKFLSSDSELKESVFVRTIRQSSANQPHT